METSIGILEKEMAGTVTFLNSLLVDEYSLYTKTRNAHWNVQGENFHGLHTFFEMQYESIDGIIDEIAERVRSLGHFTLGSIKEFLTATHKGAGSQVNINSQKIIQTLVNDHEIIIREIRKNITPISENYKDYGTADFVTELMERHKKMARMLRTHLTI